MPAQISILDLLCTSHVYKDILDSALIESCVPSDINATDFFNLVGHLSSSCALSFKPTEIPVVEPDHTLLLHKAIMVSNFAIKRVMIDNGSALNICTLKFINKLGILRQISSMRLSPSKLMTTWKEPQKGLFCCQSRLD